MMFSFESIQTVLVDIDGTLTATDGIESLETPLAKHLSSLAGKPVHLNEDTDPCTPENLASLDISPDALFHALQTDFSRHTSMPDDAVFFLQKMKQLKKAVFTASTNSRLFCNLKLSLGLPASFDHCDYITGYFPGNAFGDPKGKFAPDYFQKILQAGPFSPQHTLMVGDDLAHDIIPAQKAGIQYIVQIDRHTPTAYAEESGFIKVNSLKTLFLPDDQRMNRSI